MKIMEAIAAADQLCNNMIGEPIKRAWLSELDGRIYYEIMQPCGASGDFSGYDDITPSDTELLIPYPYDSLYVTHLQMEIARHNSEIPRYENARIVFNERLEAFRRWWVRTHEIKSPTIRFPLRRY